MGAARLSLQKLPVRAGPGQTLQHGDSALQRRNRIVILPQGLQSSRGRTKRVRLDRVKARELANGRSGLIEVVGRGV
jgi:hypothetical protein